MTVEFPGAGNLAGIFLGIVADRRFRNELTQRFQRLSADSLLLRGREFIASEQGVLSAEQGISLL